jgi:hypothetical protein
MTTVIVNTIRKPPFLRAYSLLLFGYSLFGRTVAYLGVPPVFIGEVILAWGLFRAPIVRALPKLMANPLFLLFLSFLSVCAVWTAFGMRAYGVVALRDGAIWGYGLFSIIAASYVLRNPALLDSLFQSYGRMARIYIFVAPVIGILSARYVDVWKFPGLPVGPFEQKPGDVMVHFAGIMAFLYLGFGRFSLPQLIVLVIGVLSLGSIGRGGLVAFLCAILVVFTLKPRFHIIAMILGATIIAMTAFSFLDFETQVFGRTISATQIRQNMLSIVGLGGNVDLQDTRQWRLDWWKEIVDYTVHGDYFWTGKGFGINLADSDGFQIIQDGQLLRSPHNSHMTFLARGGVPVFALWVALQLSWALAMVRVVFQARARRDAYWERLGIFLLAYWTAMIVNMNFDVYLEGPMGGIWFWTIFGLGLATIWLYRYRRDSVATPAVALGPLKTLSP